MRSASRVRQGLLFVAISGAGWLLDTSVFMTLSGPFAWNPIAANIVSGSCGVLLVFTISSRSIFQRNSGSMLQKIGVLLAFNLVVIVASSFVLGAIATQLGLLAGRLQVAVPPAGIRLASKVLVTPVTLALNFLVVRFLLERFVGMRVSSAAALDGGPLP